MECKVLYDYTKQEPDELSIVEGDIVTDIDKSGGEWWKVTLKRTGERGLIPGNYVKVTKSHDPQGHNELKSSKDICKFPSAVITFEKFMRQGWNESWWFEGSIVDQEFGIIPVALKTWGKDDILRERYFLGRAKTMSQLNHDNVMKFIGVYLSHHPACIVLEVLTEGDLLKLLCEAHGPFSKDPPKLSLADRTQIAIDVAQGCQYLQEQRIIHLNIMAQSCYVVNSMGGSSNISIKIGGFDFAVKMIDDVFKTLASTFNSNVKWSAPELFNSESITTEVDKWSYGIILYEIFSLGFPPYPFLNDDVVVSYVTGGGRMSKPTNHYCPDIIYEIMQHCWELLPDRRISYDKILSTLNCYLDAELNQQEEQAAAANKKSSLKSGLMRIFQKGKASNRPADDQDTADDSATKANLNSIYKALVNKYHEDIPECDDDFTFYEDIDETEVRIRKISLANLQILGLNQTGSSNYGTFHDGTLVLKKDSTDQSIPVAVKTMKPATLSLAQFLSEAKTICNFNHKNIIKFIGVCLDRDPVCTVMERFHGKDSLQAILRATSTGTSLASLFPFQKQAEPFHFSLANSIQIALDIAEACMYLQYQKVIHTYIAACNCFLFRNQAANCFTTKLSGFDNAISLSVKDSHYEIPKEYLYPVKWTPPEVFLESKYRLESDIWSYGIMLWELFYGGRMPYPGLTNRQTKQMIQEGNRLLKPPKCPQKIYFSIMKACWLMSPDERIKFDKIIGSLREHMGNVSELEKSLLNEEAEPSAPIDIAEPISPSQSPTQSTDTSLYDEYYSSGYEDIGEEKQADEQSKDNQKENETSDLQTTQERGECMEINDTDPSKLIESEGGGASDDGEMEEMLQDEEFLYSVLSSLPGVNPEETIKTMKEVANKDNEEISSFTDSNPILTTVMDNGTDHEQNMPKEFQGKLSELVTVKKKQISTRLAMLAKNQEARGIIFIVGIHGSDGTEIIDVENIEATFKELNFVTYVVQDPPADEIYALIQAAADVQLYPYECEHVAFYFVGQGGRNEDGDMFIVGLEKDESRREILYVYDHIINPLKCLHERKISRLFFFDCCHQSKSESTSCCSIPRPFLEKKRKPCPGELVAYATNDNVRSWEDKGKGGIWTYHLCKNFREFDDPITSILSKTYDDVVKTRDSFQQPVILSSLGFRKLKNTSTEQQVPADDTEPTTSGSLPSTELFTVKKKQISARLALPKNHKARGIIFIVGVYGADGTEIDVENIETTFKELNFVTYIVQDPPADEISALIQAAADVQLYPYKYEYVAFYFAGHGGRDEEGKMFIVGLQKDDEKKEILYVDDHIINPLKCLHERKISRLFFFDCCQSKGEGTAYRSATVLKRKSKPYPGEVIAYATNDGEKSWGDREKGGIWTYHLCKNFRELDEPVTTILSKTYDDVVEARDSFQQPLVVASLGMRKLKGISGQPASVHPIITESTDFANVSTNDPVIHSTDSMSANEGSLKEVDKTKQLEKENTELDSKKPLEINSDNEISQQKPITVQAVYCALKDYSSHWNDFACELEVDDEYRDTLEADNSLSDEEKLERIITQWIEKGTCDVSWNKIISVNEELEFGTKNLKEASRICFMNPDIWREVFNCLKRKASCWSDLAQELKISDSFRDELEQNTTGNDRRKLEKVIKEWLDESKGYKPTWEKIIRAVKELPELAEEVQKLEAQCLKESS